MSLDIDALFACEPNAAAAEAEPVPNPEPHSVSGASTAHSTPCDDEAGGVSPMDDDLIDGPVAATGLPFGMHIDMYAEDTIKSLLRERDVWKAEAEKHSEAYEELARRVYRNAIVDADLPTNIMHRLNLLESDTGRYRSENRTLRKNFKVTESEVATLQNEIAGQRNRLKGARKKVRNAKDAVDKQESKAKTAVHDKKLRITSERKMKQERNEAIAEVQSLQKSYKDLQAVLEVEQSGRPHLRKEDTALDTTTAVVPIQIIIRRGDFLKLSTVFESNQSAITEQMQRWYDDWKKPKEVTQLVVGANYTSNKESGMTAVNVDRLYADMVELFDGHQETGAEHDRPRSKTTLEMICRKAEEQQNSQD